MIKYIKKRLTVLKATILIFIILILGFLIYSDFQKEYFLKNNEINNKFTDWIQFNTNGVLILIGAFVTIIAVLLSINNERKLIEEKKKRDLTRICVVIHYELTLFLNSLYDKFFEYIVMYHNHDFNIQNMPDIKFTSLYTLNKDFKPFLYELISIDDTNESLEIFEFFKKYEKCLELITDPRYFGLESLSDILKYCFDNKYTELTSLTEFRYERKENSLSELKNLDDTEKKLLNDFIKENRKIHQQNDFNLIKNKCSNEILKIINFLEKYKNIKS